MVELVEINYYKLAEIGKESTGFIKSPTIQILHLTTILQFESNTANDFTLFYHIEQLGNTGGGTGTLVTVPDVVGKLPLSSTTSSEKMGLLSLLVDRARK